MLLLFPFVFVIQEVKSVVQTNHSLYLAKVTPFTKKIVMHV